MSVVMRGWLRQRQRYAIADEVLNHDLYVSSVVHSFDYVVDALWRPSDQPEDS